MITEQRLMVLVTKFDMFICESWPWLLAILILFLCWIGAMIWIDQRQ